MAILFEEDGVLQKYSEIKEWEFWNGKEWSNDINEYRKLEDEKNRFNK